MNKHADDAGIGVAAAQARRSVTGEDIPSPVVIEDSALDGALYDHIGASGVRDEHTFTLDHKDRRGHRWTGQFTCKVLTIDERTRVGVLRARILNGLAPDMVDRATLNLAEMRAHLAVALKKAPEWAANLREVRDTEVLVALYEEVSAHERRFWSPVSEGASADNGAGQGVGTP